MTDFMLRTDTEAQMNDALEAAGLLEDGPMGTYPVAGCYIDRIGPIPAQLDPEGEVIRDGDSRYHLNLRVTIDLTAAQVALLPTFTPTPGVPYRVFA